MAADKSKSEDSEKTVREKFEIKNNRIMDLPIALIMILDSDVTIVEVSAGWQELLDYSRDEMIGKSVFDFIHPDDVPSSKKEVDIVNEEGDIFYFENRYKHKNGSYKHLTWNASSDPETGLIYGIAQDITKRKIAEEKLRFQSEIFQNIAEGVYLIRMSDQKIVYANRKLEEMFGYDKGELLNEHVSIVNAPTDESPEEIATEIIESLRKTGTWSGEVKNIKKNGEHFWCSANVSSFVHHEHGNVWISVHSDISERKRAEESVNESLKEKEILLKEIHHRVKNNLQVVSSLLNIQANNISDENVVKHLKDLQSKVMSMSLIHENIYQSETLSDVNIRKYIIMLKDNLLQSYIQNGRSIKISTDIDDIILGIERATPLGLIIAELISNSLKHAFVNSDGGNVMVDFKRANNSLVLTVSDDGKGFPDKKDIEKNGSLGLKLVSMLVHQLGATIETKSEEGVETKIIFKA